MFLCRAMCHELVLKMKCARLRVKSVGSTTNQIMIRERKGDKDVSTTTIFTRVLNRVGKGVRILIDSLSTGKRFGFMRNPNKPEGTA